MEWQKRSVFRGLFGCALNSDVSLFIPICFGKKSGEVRNTAAAFSGFKTAHLHFYFTQFLILSLTSRHILNEWRMNEQSEVKREQLKSSWLQGCSSAARRGAERPERIQFTAVMAAGEKVPVIFGMWFGSSWSCECSSIVFMLHNITMCSWSTKILLAHTVQRNLF